ncbi:thioredoxin family protein [Vibrio sp. SCSIO 43132]|uniref:protein-disulfide reductase DsbD family protein n=1 Tax=Vibrio sp. SCSIO 43132 TaxID=2779363 RepID=UPI001CA9862F|nr:protein-disulfide reductase DsbD domain-containing protein [Vibrio sp. SCSIO 43132]UAB72997.1 thioredoxin family protein [Vibrio sp. SCSIO 43132]
MRNHHAPDIMPNCPKLLLLLLLFFCISPSVAANTTGWMANEQHPPVQVKLSLPGTTNKNQKVVHALLEVTLEDNWKTYWRSPGEGGVAPSIRLSPSTNIDQINWHWPSPNYFQQFGLTVQGYKNYVAFPLDIQLKNWDESATFNATITLPSCTDICVLTDYPVSLSFTPAELVPDSEILLRHNQAMSKVPLKEGKAEIKEVVWDETSSMIQVTLFHPDGWQNPNVFIETTEDSDDQFQQPSLSIEGITLTAVSQVSNTFGKVQFDLPSLRVTVLDDLLAQELSTTWKKGNVFQISGNLLSMLWFAFVGGLILNVMPCVLPVLGIKINSLLLSAPNKRTQQAQFFASAAGILVSFWLIAFALIGLKWAGYTIGWGIQFQQPWFLAFLALITLAFSLNLFGVFEIKLPGKVSDSLAKDRGKGLGNHFAQGAFATLLATPCSAPFLGTAVAFALGGSVQNVLLIFTFLGLGFAAPWLVFALFPNSTRFLPKPGAWMNKLKIVFALMMSLTTFWLISLLHAHIGQFGTVVTGIATLVLLLILLTSKYGARLVAIFSSATLLVVGLGMIIAGTTSSYWAEPIVDDLNWQPLDSQAIRAHVADGKLVFVDVTADWCITCKANKIGTLLQSPTYEHLQEKNVVLMRGDWTTANSKITEFLMSHGRYGVPLNVVYGPDSPLGTPLPVLLTHDSISRSLEAARGN